MLTDWTHWLSSLHPDELILALLPILLLDGPRYALGTIALWLCDLTGDVMRTVRGTRQPPSYQHCPSVCVIVAGLNEAETLGQTLASIWGTYPSLEIIVVDDGSRDGMAQIAREFANQHAGVTVLRKPHRGGKSSALNFALPFTKAEILVCVDSDSHLDATAIWEVVQPFTDPRVGAVSGNVAGRSPWHNLVTWLQAFEYLRCIFMGRMLASRLGVLGIVSGAFGAYRRSAIERLKGWDVGPGEDGDLTLRLRKAGYTITFAPYAQCLTQTLTSWRRLLKQRRRWEWAAVTYECRKHVDMANVLGRNFRFSDFLVLADRWFFNIVLQYFFLGYGIWLCFHVNENTGNLLALYYLTYVLLESIQLLIIVYYSNDRWRDFCIGLVVPLMPFYYGLLRLVSLLAITEEIFTRRSYRDEFVPDHVRKATWHW